MIQNFVSISPDIEFGNGDRDSEILRILPLDEDQLFYLRSRGIEEATARSLLIYAFAREVIERIRVDSLRAALEQTLLARLPESERIRELQ